MHAGCPTLCYSFPHQHFIFCSLTLSLSTCFAVLGAHLLGAAENAMLGTFAPTTSQRMLRSHPQLALPIHPLPQAARNACQPPPLVNESC